MASSSRAAGLERPSEVVPSASGPRWAPWAGVGCTMLAYRVLLLAQDASARLDLRARIARTLGLLPLVIYQDLVLLVVVGGAALALRRGARRHPRIDRLVAALAWVTALALSLYAALSWRVYDVLHSLPSFQLWRRSQGFRGVPVWLHGSALVRTLLVLASGPALAVAGSWLAVRIAPTHRRGALWLRPGFLVPALLVYAAAADLGCRRLGMPAPIVQNPHWAGLVSILRGIPTAAPIAMVATDPDLGDFRPAGDRMSDSRPDRAAEHALPDNVAVVVLESVAAAYVDGFGAEHRLTPEIRRLAEHGVRYRRISANQPWSSSALAALVCSVYPLLEWQTLSDAIPDLAVPGLPDVLRQRGYRTAMFTTSYFHFEGDDVFCLGHGFETLRHDIHDRSAGPPRPGSRSRTHEDAMVDQFLAWVDQAPGRPFCAMFWTSITHSPYTPTGRLTLYDRRSLYQTRYFNAIAQSDRAVGDLARGLARRGLLDRTLLVVVGDHGEGFDEHGSMGHGACLYEEAVHVPLLICQPGRFRGAAVSDVLGQQIDVAPTILDLLDIPEPPLWQGRSLRSGRRPPRIYLFSAWDELTFGVREDDWKYTIKPGTAWEELYDLAADPGERCNRAGDRAARDRVMRMRRRLDAWRAFQNHYLYRPRLGGGGVLGNDDPSSDGPRPR